MAEDLKKDPGQFNVFRLNNADGTLVDCKPYNRKGYYKISIINGHTKLYYADKTIAFERTGLLFSSPHIPYAWEHVGEEQSGFFCVFTEKFFSQYTQIRDYPIFRPGSTPLFEVTPAQAEEISAIFRKMLNEITSDFIYKYDVLYNMVLSLIYYGLKMQPAASSRYNESNGAHRIASLFAELLERQFPIGSPGQRMSFRFPVEFAGQLSVHVNHLNRSLKEIMGKTTTQLIAERVAQEARALLKHTDWNISEIAWCLGFEDLSNFINFFKKNTGITPRQFRQMQP